MRVFAEAEGLEAKSDFRFQPKGKKGVDVDPVKPGRIVSRTGRKLDSRAKAFEGITQASEQSVTFKHVTLTVGQGNEMISVTIGDIAVEAAFVESLLTAIAAKLAPDAPVTMSFREANFMSGHDLMAFSRKQGFELKVGDVEQA